MARYDFLWTYFLNGTGAVAPANLGTKLKSLTVRIDDSAAGDCWVRAPLSPTVAPANSTDPGAAGANALAAQGWIRLTGKGSSHTFRTLQGDFYQYLEIFDKIAGGLQISGEPA